MDETIKYTLYLFLFYFILWTGLYIYSIYPESKDNFFFYPAIFFCSIHVFFCKPLYDPYGENESFFETFFSAIKERKVKWNFSIENYEFSLKDILLFPLGLLLGLNLAFGVFALSITLGFVTLIRDLIKIILYLVGVVTGVGD